MEGLTFRGGSYGLRVYNSSAATDPTVYLKNCAFNYATAYNGLSVEGGHTIAQNCTGTQCKLDIGNYHLANAVLCRNIEIGCTFRNTGWGAAGTNNASSSHDGNSVCRVNGNYHDCDGPVVVDVNSGTTSWNVRCTAAAPLAGTAVYNSQCSGLGGMWLDECTSTEAAETDLWANVNGKAYTRNCTGLTTQVTATGGTIEAYDEAKVRNDARYHAGEAVPVMANRVLGG
jgi:hypothetical protein